MYGPGSPLVSLVESQAAELDADIHPRDVDSLRNSTVLEFVHDGRRWPVTLKRLSDVIGLSNRTQKARLAIPADPPPVGMTGTLVWQRSSFALPPSFLVQRDGQLGVFVARDGTASFVELPGAQEGRPLVVDLPPDTPLIDDGRNRVMDGQAVEVR